MLTWQDCMSLVPFPQQVLESSVEGSFNSKGDAVLVLDSGSILPVHSSYLESRSEVKVS